MTAHLEPYPHMKESGVQWLGAVPEHWAVLAVCQKPVCASAVTVNVGGEIQAVGYHLLERPWCCHTYEKPQKLEVLANKASERHYAV